MLSSYSTSSNVTIEDTNEEFFLSFLQTNAPGTHSETPPREIQVHAAASVLAREGFPAAFTYSPDITLYLALLSELWGNKEGRVALLLAKYGVL